MGKLWTDAETLPFMTPWREAEVLPDKGRLEGIIDGDSYRLRINLGFNHEHRAYCRLLAEGIITTPDDPTDDSVDAWETKGAEKYLGDLAEARAEELMPVGQPLRVWSFKGRGDTGKYGRWLVIVLIPVDGGWKSVGDILVEEGHAVYKQY
jgi:endonuclease YncB( thermonuclease family)